MKTICLDYDGSYNVFPELFDMIIKQCLKQGYKVILATMRYPQEEDSGLRELSKKIKIYYTGRKAKFIYLKNIGIEPDLWIDDRPDFILNDARESR